MNHKRLERIKKLHEALKNTNGIKSKQLQNLARQLGREIDKRGKEPTWINPYFKDLRPVSIPCHSGEMKRFTAQNVLNYLDEDIEHWEDWLDEN